MIQRFQPLLVNFLHRYGVAVHQHEDVLQEVFLKVHQSADRYRAHEPLAPWLITIALNTIRNTRRDERRGMKFLDAFKREQPPSEDTTDRWVESQQSLSWLEQQITRLPDTQKEVLILSSIQGLRMQDIARIMNCPENTVKTHLRRARLKLAEALVSRESQEVNP